jgi:hypothetical protein
MKAGNTPFRDPAEKKPMDVLQKFIGVFTSKGWLNQTLRIKYRDRRYRIFCSERTFFAYRINDHCGVSWGFPGWLVCIVTHDQMIEDSEMSAFTSSEPSAHDWLRCITDGDFELI